MLNNVLRLDAAVHQQRPLVLFLSSLQSCVSTDLPQGQCASELQTFVALKEQHLCFRTAIKAGQNLIKLWFRFYVNLAYSVDDSPGNFRTG